MEYLTTPQHRSPPFVNFYAGETEYLAILDTGALDISFDTPTAKFVGLERFPSAPKLYDWGWRPAWFIPLTLGHVIIPTAAAIRDGYPDHKLVRLQRLAVS